MTITRRNALGMLAGALPASRLAAARRQVRYLGNGRQDLTADDVRCTVKGTRLYALLMGRPARRTTIAALGTAAKTDPGKILNVELLGYGGKLEWARKESGLQVDLPELAPGTIAATLRIALA
jgi:hypothetical protein